MSDMEEEALTYINFNCLQVEQNMHEALGELLNVSGVSDEVRSAYERFFQACLHLAWGFGADAAMFTDADRMKDNPFKSPDLDKFEKGL